MTGINCNLTLDIRHIPKHLPNTLEMLRLLNKEGFVHVFNDEATLTIHWLKSSGFFRKVKLQTST